MLSSKALPRAAAPDGGDEGKAGERAPFFGEVVVDQLLAGALEAVGLLFEGQQGRVADEDGGVGTLEHRGRGRRQRDEGNVGVAPLMKEDARVGEGGAAGGVGGHGAQCGEGLAGAADQQQRAHAAFRGDGAAGQDAQAGIGGQGGDGDEADVGRAGGQPRRALGGRHAVDLIALGEFGIEGRVLEVPHERRGVEEVDGGDAETMRSGLEAHAY